MENKIKQIIVNDNELILICTIKSYILDRSDFCMSMPEVGNVIEVNGSQVFINKQLCADKSQLPIDKNELNEKFKNLPEIFQHRINMLRLNVPDFDIFYAKEEIENCFAAYQQSLKPWKIHFDDAEQAHFWVGEPTVVDKLCMAYRFKDHDNLLEDELMLFDQGKNLAMPRVDCIKRYISYLQSNGQK